MSSDLTPPDPDAVNWLERRLDDLDPAEMIAALPGDDVADELRELGLDPGRLILPTAAAIPDTAKRTLSERPVSEASSLRAVPRAAERPSSTRARTAAPRWRVGVLAALGLLAVALASTAVLRTLRERPAAEAQTDHPAEVYKGDPREGPLKSDPGAGGITPAEVLAASRERLEAFTAQPTDSVGVGAAISEVRRAYEEARQFEAIAGAPVDPSLSSASLGRLLSSTFNALGQPDSAQAYAR